MDGVGWRGVALCVVEWRCVVWRGVVWCSVVWCGVAWCGVEWCGVLWCGVEWSGVAWWKWCGGCGVGRGAGGPAWVGELDASSVRHSMEMNELA